MCARYQARPTEKHLNAVKRIFRYLKGTVNRGLWYSKDSSIALIAFADADHAGCQDTRRSTSGSMQFLGDRLISGLSKRQKNTAISSTKAEYITLSGPTLQVVLDALKLTQFYNAFEISTDVPEIYMQEIWVTVARHHSSLRFKLDGKSHTVNVDNFRDMLKICPKLPGQKFKEPPLEEAILSFIRDLGHTGEIKFLSDVNVNHMHQPWRSFAAIINKCLSGKTTALESLRLSHAQILWGMYHNKLTMSIYCGKTWYFKWRTRILKRTMTCSQVKSKKENSESSPKTKPSQASKGKRIKTSAKGDKPAKTKSKGLTILSEVALSEAEQMKLATKRSMKEFHISHVSGSGDRVNILSKVPDEKQQTGSGTNEGAGDKPEVPDVLEYRSESEEESWTFSQGEDEEEDEEHDSDDDNDDNDDEDDDKENDNQRTESDNEGDDFVHPNLSTYIADDQEKEEEKADDDDDDVTSGQKVSTPPDYELTEEDENKQDEGDEDNGELYRDMNINLSRSDAEMTDAQTNPETKEAQVTLTTEPLVVQL
ncbi:hypothetical protein Tco_0901314 [Tanacetum coccineum]